jgi:hypothetical protein
MIDDDDYGAVGGMRGNRSTRRKPAPVPLCMWYLSKYWSNFSNLTLILWACCRFKALFMLYEYM